VRVAPPLLISDDEVDEALVILGVVLGELAHGAATAGE
jgi:4-aminobutyrate aminotransferase-like enzyme